MKKVTILLISLGFVYSDIVFADLQSDQDKALLIASQADTNLTKEEKLFKYRCPTIRKYLGFADSIMGKAIKYSCDKAEIGITLYAGKDLGNNSPEKVAQHFKNQLAKRQVKAEVFIKSDHPYGTSMGFYINGGSWLRDPVDPLKGIELLDALAADAIMILYSEGRIKEWPKGLSAKDLAKTALTKQVIQSR